MLDSAADSGGTARTLGFTIQVNAGQRNCTTGATPRFFTVAPAADTPHGP